MGPDNAFAPILDIAVSFASFGRPWFIAGGWAIDLFLGRVTRDHEDVDIAVLRDDQEAIHAYLSDWDLVKIVDGRREPWDTATHLELPIHEIHAHRSGETIRDLELLLEDAVGNRWAYRRDHRITRPLSAIGMRTDSGIPFLTPELVLLYKAKHHGPRDEDDFGLASPRLGPEPRVWLKHALEVGHPGHPWIHRL